MINSSPLRDRFGRRVRYLRVSVTDRCNLRCLYCVPNDEPLPMLDHHDILSYEEIIRVTEDLLPLGIDKIRLTGGEPLVRRNIDYLVSRLNNLVGIEDVSMTTNGVLLAEMAGRLKDAGLRRINVSLDTLRADKFAYITRRDFFQRVMAGIETALTLGFSPVKINVVAIRGFNDDEILDFAVLARRLQVQVRFIEYMPIGESTNWQADQLIPVAEIKKRIEEEYGALKPVRGQESTGPAELFGFQDGGGYIGFVSALSNHFCAQCNRVRITADGRLRPCLFSDLEYDLKALLRRGGDSEAVRALFLEAVAHKPSGHGISCNAVRKCVRVMSTIGG